MANKSVAYMLVAVLIGVTLITAVPDQIARYATPSQMLSIESSDGESTVVSKESNESVELYWDSTSTPEENSSDDYEVWFDIANTTGHGGPWNDSVEVEELGFSVTSDGVSDLNDQVEDLANQLEIVSEEFADVESSIADVESVVADAVTAAEAASEAVEAVASIANEPASTGVDAAEAARGTRSALSTMNMFMWYAFDALIAVGVYFLAKRRFS